MSYQQITKAGVDAAEPLDFTDPPPPSFPAMCVTIAAVSPEGYPVTITLNDPAQGAMTNWIALLQAKGFTPPAGRKEAHTAPAGVPLDTPTCTNRNCSNHGKPMAPSQHGGWFCMGKDPTTGNLKGYCRETS